MKKEKRPLNEVILSTIDTLHKQLSNACLRTTTAKRAEFFSHIDKVEKLRVEIEATLSDGLPVFNTVTNDMD